ncbi:hypothetical protein RRSWK_01017 [Rhodopirellula sp. SWK7]|nr:hypothetical protein RRSWK_01017 [Rhodopirellula sp. SWK7]
MWRLVQDEFSIALVLGRQRLNAFGTFKRRRAGGPRTLRAGDVCVKELIGLRSQSNSSKTSSAALDIAKTREQTKIHTPMSLG